MKKTTFWAFFFLLIFSSQYSFSYPETINSKKKSSCNFSKDKQPIKQQNSRTSKKHEAKVLTSLGVGDIGFSSFNTDGDDEFSFVLLTDISGTTEIHFTDQGFNDVSNTLFGSEGTITWTYTGNLPSGTEVSILLPKNANTTGTSTVGGIETGTTSETGSFSMSSSGDSLIAYTGTVGTPTTYIAAIYIGGAGFTNNASTSTSSGIPLGLSIGANTAMQTGNTDDNFQYNCALGDISTVSNLRASLFTIGNFTNTTSTINYPAPGCAYLTGGNTPPTISIDNSTLAYVEGTAAVQIDAAGTVNDPDGDADWNGGTLVVQITANNEAADVLSISDIDGDGTAITISGTNIFSNGVDIGDLSTSGGSVTNGTALTITFDSDATNANVQEVLQSLRYRNISANPITSNRTITITATDSNTASANDTRTVSVTSTPDVTSVNVPSNDTYVANEDLNFIINFNENITVNTGGGVPQLAINIGVSTRQATYQSGTGTTALTFRYTVQTGDLDTDGIVVGTLDPNNGTLQNGSGVNANLTLNGVGSTTSVLVDAIAPTGYSVVIDQSPINAANDDAVSFSFAGAEVGATYNYTFTSSGAPGSVTGSGTIATATDQITAIDISGLADGTITLSVTLTDVNGNTGTAATDTETKETVAPTGYSVVIDQSPINAANDDAVSFTFAGAEVGASYNYAFTSSGAPGSVTGSGTIATATDQITSIDISGLADGTITLSVTLTDVNGNTGAAATDTKTKETVAPTGYSVTIDQSPINAANDDAVSFSFASAEVGATYNYTFTSSGAPGSVTGSGTISTATDQITAIDISGLADGTITLSVTLTDVNGNTGTAATDTETKETVAPTGYSVTIDQSPINAANDDAVSFSFAGAEVGATYNYTFTSSGAPGSVTGSGTISTATDQITAIDISGLADGTITLSVTLTDVNGNTGAAATDTETKETVAPTGYSVTIDQSPINAANDDAVSFSFAGAEVGATYNYTFTSSGAPGSVTGSGTISTATDQITAIDISSLADGTITLSVTLTDVNGNTGAAATDTETKETVAITWTGTTSNDWNTASNWNPNSIPVANSEVTIPNSLTNYPTISSSVTVNSINIASGASLIANAAVTGTTTYTRNLPTTNWYLVSAPVSGETQQDVIANHTFATGSGSNIGIGGYTNNGATPWSYATNSSTGPLVSGAGVSMKLAAAGDVSITGTLNTSNVSFPINTGTRNNFNLIGNPFTSYVNSSTFAAANTGLLSEETVWLWDGTQYVTYNNVSPIELAPSQGFFVEANGSGNIMFSTANQSHQGSDTFMKETPIPNFELFIESNSNKKSTKVFYVADKTTGWDNGYDSKMFGGVSQNFAVYTELVTNNEGKKLAIQTLPNVNYETMVVPVGIIAEAGEEITFSINSLNLPTGIEVYLEDRNINTFINLSSENYTITLSESTNNSGQFYLHTTNQSLSNTDAILNSINLYKSSNKTITINGLYSNKASLSIYSIIGQEMFSKEFSSNGNTNIKLPKLSSGVYLAKLNTPQGDVSKKIIID
ncbi:T9SS type A sorting domain-containing protein [Tenacibaculum sp. 190524A02b]|uniref:beta strand repeat-containing protein n=1 Tax=Tenacibaculum vairaonense TaxID=3137860 RepID=UPI0031FB6EFD